MLRYLTEVKEHISVFNEAQMTFGADYYHFQETVMVNAWYEALSVLQLMAMVCLSEANTLLLPKTINDGYQTKLSEGNIKTEMIDKLHDFKYSFVAMNLHVFISEFSCRKQTDFH